MEQKKFIIKIASTNEELKELYHTRYKEMLCFYNSDLSENSGSDYSIYDEIAKNVIAIDTNTNKIVGSYRIVTTSDLNNTFGINSFVCENEYDISKLKQNNNQIMELSRAFINQEYRNGSLLLLLWQFVFNYALENKMKYIIGDASFKSLDPLDFKEELSYLYYNYPIDDNLEIKSKMPNSTMNFMKEEEIDVLKVKQSLPPLIKAYIKFGCCISKEYFIDEPFGSVDVFILVDTDKCNINLINKIINR